MPGNVLFKGGAARTAQRNLCKECNAHTLLRLPTGIFHAWGVNDNVQFCDYQPSCEQPWPEALWINDLHAPCYYGRC